MKKHNEPDLRLDSDPEPANYAALAKLGNEIVRLGYDATTAAHYAVLISENQTIDSDGLVLVVDDGKIQARLKLNLSPYNK